MASSSNADRATLNADSAPVYNGIDYFMGVSCWHVIGYAGGDFMRPSLLCGKPFDDLGIGGSSLDVWASEMRVCRTCDRMTNGQAAQIDGSGVES